MRNVRDKHVNAPRQEEPIKQEYRPAVLAASQRTENDTSIQKGRAMLNQAVSSLANNPEVQKKGKELLSQAATKIANHPEFQKLNSAVMNSPFLGDLLERGRKAAISRIKNFQ